MVMNGAVEISSFRQTDTECYDYVSARVTRSKCFFFCISCSETKSKQLARRRNWRRKNYGKSKLNKKRNAIYVVISRSVYCGLFAILERVEISIHFSFTDSLKSQIVQRIYNVNLCFFLKQICCATVKSNFIFNYLHETNTYQESRHQKYFSNRPIELHS